MDIKELSAILRDSGVVGAGGAGFPTYAKLNAAADTILLNCAECEPLLRLHRQLLEKYVYEILKTFALVGEVLGVRETVVGIKEAYKETVDALKSCVGQFRNMRIALLPEIYPAGDEVVLIYEATGRVVRPGGLPIECGVVVFNVETVYNVYRALEKKQPVTDKLVSVAAGVKEPVTVRVPLGCTVGEIVGLAGGAAVADPVYWIGGPMMGFPGNKNTLVTKTTNAVLVLPGDHPLIQRKQAKSAVSLKRAASCCCQCTMCTDLCPRHNLGHPIEPHLFMRAATCKDVQDPGIFLNTFFCSSCGLCELYSCFQGLSPRSLMAEYKNGLRKAGVRAPAVTASPVTEDREYRKAPIGRLVSRLGLAEYDRDAPLSDRGTAVSRVRLPLSQHIGAPSAPIVRLGQRVQRGDVVAEAAKGLSVALHASVGGVVTEVSDQYIVIENQGTERMWAG